MLIQKLQKWTFWSTLLALLIPLCIQEYFDFFDSGIVLYFILIVIGLLILGHWIYWYAVSRERSVIFIFNGLLLLCIVSIMIFQLFTRFLFLYNFEEYSKVINSDIWSYRVFPEVIIFIWLFSWIFSRMHGNLPTIIDDKEIIENEDKQNILIIDDDSNITDVLKNQLDLLGVYNIYIANTLNDGLTLFNERKYFLIILDLVFDRNSKESMNLAKDIRKKDKYVWITILTGYFVASLNQELFENIDDIVVKPLVYADLKNYLILWNLKYKRRMYYLKTVESKLFCFGEKIKDIYFMLERKEDKY
jgi:CheY-like chemotaxis protein